MTNKITHIKCDSCGNNIKSQYMYGSIVYCEACHSYKVLSNYKDKLSPVFYKIIPFKHNARYYKELILKYFCKNGHPKLFSRMQVTGGFKRYYLPVMEIGCGENRQYVILNSSHPILEQNIAHKEKDSLLIPFSETISEEKTRNMTVNDFNPVYSMHKEDTIEFIPVDISTEKVKAIFHIDSTEMLVIKYLPIFSFSTNLGEIVCMGTDDLFTVLNKELVDNAIQLKNIHFKTRKDIVNLIIKIIIGIISSLVAIVVAYKIFTEGFNAGSVLDLIALCFLAALSALWIGLWIFLYTFAFVLVFGPIIKLFYAIFKLDTKKGKTPRPSESEGRKLMSC